MKYQHFFYKKQDNSFANSEDVLACAKCRRGFARDSLVEKYYFLDEWQFWHFLGPVTEKGMLCKEKCLIESIIKELEHYSGKKVKLIKK